MNIAFGDTFEMAFFCKETKFKPVAKEHTCTMFSMPYQLENGE
ncbi:unnamed protein product [Brassica oleracea]